MLNEKLTIIVPQSRWAPNNSSRNFLKFVREQLNKSNSLKMLTRKAVSCTQSDLLHAPEYVCFNTLRYMLGQSSGIQYRQGPCFVAVKTMKLPA